MSAQIAAAAAAAEHVFYVHCNFCNTILAVSVPGNSMLNIVTVRCGHCTNLLSVSLRGLMMHSAPAAQDHLQEISLISGFRDQSGYPDQFGSAASSSSSTSKLRLPAAMVSYSHQTQQLEQALDLHVRPPEKRQRVPSAYNRFIKEEIRRIKENNPDISHREAFSTAAKNWAHYPNIHFGLSPGPEGGKKLSDHHQQRRWKKSLSQDRSNKDRSGVFSFPKKWEEEAKKPIDGGGGGGGGGEGGGDHLLSSRCEGLLQKPAPLKLAHTSFSLSASPRCAAMGLFGWSASMAKAAAAFRDVGEASRMSSLIISFRLEAPRRRRLLPRTARRQSAAGMRTAARTTISTTAKGRQQHTAVQSAAVPPATSPHLGRSRRRSRSLLVSTTARDRLILLAQSAPAGKPAASARWCTLAAIAVDVDVDGDDGIIKIRATRRRNGRPRSTVAARAGVITVTETT
ncbi:hypothetical protein GUJ93_ZPchr0009g593 [Zizania palustris]|uniref:Uncharacterized protein n=1 Tax=Zizania palustris TaxID=103762 RepID=A0A8J5RRV8_ZIZPA|nr:hypothetical protein GUJ93_ZPchr0009g593 [Zizania palustris]